MRILKVRREVRRVTEFAKDGSILKTKHAGYTWLKHPVPNDLDAGSLREDGTFLCTPSPYTPHENIRWEDE